MLLAITPNPALDRTMVIPNIRLGTVHRTERVIVVAGGKGINVARAAQTLGQTVRVCAPLGGFTGRFIAHLAAQEGFAGRWSWHTAGETRTCVLVVDPHGQDATVLNEQGPELTMADWQGFVDTVQSAAADATLATISGSLPPGIPATAILDIIDALAAANCPVIVDTSGAPLEATLAARAPIVKVNDTEIGTALGLPVNDVAEASVALQRLHSQGIGLGIVSLGAQGVLAISEAGLCWVSPPAVDVVSTVGSGDSLLAGIATGMLRGNELAEALQLGVACGTADALTVGGGLVHMDDVERIRTATTVQWL